MQSIPRCTALAVGMRIHEEAFSTIDYGPSIGDEMATYDLSDDFDREHGW